MKPRLLLLSLLAGLLMACSLSGAPAATQTPGADPTSTALAAAAAQTVAAVQTAAVTATVAAPTPVGLPMDSSATPESTSEATELPAPPVIGPENIAALAPLRTLASPALRKVTFSPDSSLIAASSGNEDFFGVQVWKTTTGEMVHHFELYSGIVWDTAFSPNGALLASAQDDPIHEQPIVVRVWSLADESPAAALSGPTQASSLAFSPDGSILAVGGLAGWPNGAVWLYDTSDWSLKRQFSASGQNVTALSFSPDGKTLIAGGTGGGIFLWNLAEGALTGTFDGGKQANDIAVTAKGLPGALLLASTTCSQTNTTGCVRGGVSVWNLDDRTQLQHFDDMAEAVAFSPDGKLLVSGSGANDPAIRIRTTSNWTTLTTLDQAGYSAAFSPDGAYLATLTYDSVTLWGIQP